MTSKTTRSIRFIRHKRSLKRTSGFSLKPTLIALAVSGLMTGLALLVVSQPVSAAIGPCAAPTSDLGTDSITVNVPADATYTVWTRMIAPDASHNSINLDVDGAFCYSVGGGAFAATTFADNTSNWVNYTGGTASTPLTLGLTAGNHTFKYIGTQAGVGVDKILITSDTTCMPTGVGDCPTGGTTTQPTVNLLSPAANSTATGPVTLSATAVGNGGATISNVKFLIDNQAVSTITASPYTFSWNSATVANGTHTVSAQATDTAGGTATTTPISITVNNATSCTGTPSVPTGLTVTGTTSSSVSLSWNASTPATDCVIKEYKIYRNGNLVSSATGTTYQETGLAPGGSYSYTVAAADTTGHVSAQSAAVSATTGGDSVAPSKPVNVHSTLIAANSVALAWDPSTDNTAVTGYVVYRANGAVTSGITTVVGNPVDATFSDSGLTPSTQYTYQIKAKDGAGNLSDVSDPYTITTTAASGGGGGGSDSIYLKPSTGNYLVGSTISVEVRDDSHSDLVNGVQVDLNYSKENLEFSSVDISTSEFAAGGGCPTKSGGGGAVSIACFPDISATTPGVTGDKQIAKVNFKVIATGTGSIEVATTSVLLSASTNSDVASQRLGAGYSLTNTPPPTPPAPTPSPSPSPSPSPKPSPSPSPTPPSSSRPTTGTTGNLGNGAGTSTTSSTSGSSTTIAPTGNSNPLPLSGGSQVELSDPAVVQTSTDTTASIKKVEYLLNGKLVFTASSPPYSYTVQSNNLRNGKYTLTTKTYYDNGKIDSTNSSIIVKNPMNLTQIMLQLKHYAWVLILLALIAGGGIWFMFFRNTTDEFGDTDISGGFGVPGMYEDPNGAAAAGGQIAPSLPPNAVGGDPMGFGGPPPDGGMPGSLPPGTPPGIPPVPGQGPDPFGRYQ